MNKVKEIKALEGFKKGINEVNQKFDRWFKKQVKEGYCYDGCIEEAIKIYKHPYFKKLSTKRREFVTDVATSIKGSGSYRGYTYTRGSYFTGDLTDDRALFVRRTA